jgi:hypothetical protein
VRLRIPGALHSAAPLGIGEVRLGLHLIAMTTAMGPVELTFDNESELVEFAEVVEATRKKSLPGPKTLFVKKQKETL